MGTKHFSRLHFDEVISCSSQKIGFDISCQLHRLRYPDQYFSDFSMKIYVVDTHLMLRTYVFVEKKNINIFQLTNAFYGAFTQRKMRTPIAWWIGVLTLNPLGFSPLWFEPRSGHMWESQVLLTHGQVVFFLGSPVFAHL